jgi:predicted nucleic acid-binding protein
MRVLIDTNVVLDFLQEREPFAENAARLFNTIRVSKCSNAALQVAALERIKLVKQNIADMIVVKCF